MPLATSIVGAVRDAAVFGFYQRHERMELFEEIGASPGSDENRGDDMNHGMISRRATVSGVCSA